MLVGCSSSLCMLLSFVHFPSYFDCGGGICVFFMFSVTGAIISCLYSILEITDATEGQALVSSMVSPVRATTNLAFFLPVVWWAQLLYFIDVWLVLLGNRRCLLSFVCSWSGFSWSSLTAMVWNRSCASALEKSCMLVFYGTWFVWLRHQRRSVFNRTVMFALDPNSSIMSFTPSKHQGSRASGCPGLHGLGALFTQWTPMIWEGSMGICWLAFLRESILVQLLSVEDQNWVFRSSKHTGCAVVLPWSSGMPYPAPTGILRKWPQEGERSSKKGKR